MDSPFARPKKPVELSQNEIRDMIYDQGMPCFCGKCYQEIKVHYDERQIDICECIPLDLGEQLVGVRRIADDKIFVDMILISDKEFDPETHSPHVLNRGRMEIQRAYRDNNHERKDEPV
jgi:hypothetical protein